MLRRNISDTTHTHRKKLHIPDVLSACRRIDAPAPPQRPLHRWPLNLRRVSQSINQCAAAGGVHKLEKEEEEEEEEEGEKKISTTVGV